MKAPANCARSYARTERLESSSATILSATGRIQFSTSSQTMLNVSTTTTTMETIVGSSSHTKILETIAFQTVSGGGSGAISAISSRARAESVFSGAIWPRHCV